MKKLLWVLGFGLLTVSAADASVFGFFKTVDDTTNKAKTIVRIYECGNELCGRIVALFEEDGKTIAETISKPIRVAEKLAGKPFYDGLDIIWDMSWDARRNEWRDGRIMDPKSGSIYRARLWIDENDDTRLNVRGQIGPFGRTQVWHAVPTSDLPADLRNLDVSAWEVVRW
ncbi:MAG: DUF2147 domain-containing protein [Alphaproteobacteria bacterium]|nr:DUF2147 domain-containing protein [Alphaproteobacteria bacterium]MCL2889666.1 DUF2147 domain-containing protein [Alphaproteobacteria bacterium]